MIYWPLAPTGFLLLWTALVAPIANNSDQWAIIPAECTLPLALALHVFLLLERRNKKQRRMLLCYAAIHLVVLFFILVFCLTAITKTFV
jgi:hypothetical protein